MTSADESNQNSFKLILTKNGSLIEIEFDSLTTLRSKLILLSDQSWNVWEEVVKAFVYRTDIETIIPDMDELASFIDHLLGNKAPRAATMLLKRFANSESSFKKYFCSMSVLSMLEVTVYQADVMKIIMEHLLKTLSRHPEYCIHIIKDKFNKRVVADFMELLIFHTDIKKLKSFIMLHYKHKDTNLEVYLMEEFIKQYQQQVSDTEFKYFLEQLLTDPAYYGLLKRIKWLKTIEVTPSLAADLSNYYRTAAEKDSEGFRHPSLLVQTLFTSSDSIKVWLDAGDPPDAAFPVTVKLNNGNITDVSRLKYLHNRIELLHYGLAPKQDVSLLSDICRFDLPDNKNRVQLLKEALRFYLADLDAILSRKINKHVLRWIYEAFPDLLTYVRIYGIGTILGYRTHNWALVKKVCGHENFIFQLRMQLDPEFLIRQNYFKFCLLISKQRALPSGMNFDVLMLIMRAAGLTLPRDACRALRESCVLQQDEIKQLAALPGAINVCQRVLPGGRFQFTFFKSFDEYERGYVDLQKKLKKEQTLNIKDRIAGVKYTAESRDKLAAYEAKADAVIESEKKASGRIQRYALQQRLQFSSLYQKIKADKNLINEFHEISTETPTLQWY